MSRYDCFRHIGWVTKRPNTGERKCTKLWSEKVPNLTPIWPTFELNLTSLFRLGVTMTTSETKHKQLAYAPVLYLCETSYQIVLEWGDFGLTLFKCSSFGKCIFRMHYGIWKYSNSLSMFQSWLQKLILYT